MNFFYYVKVKSIYKFLPKIRSSSVLLLYLAGMVTYLREKQSPKASSTMSMTDSGMVIDLRDSHAKKADFPILVTELGMVMDFREEQ